MYSFGLDYYGCLGVDNSHGDSVSSPIPIDFFSSIAVQEISCGDNHVAALTNNGEVFTWGCGEYGRLQHVVCHPIDFFSSITVKEISMWRQLHGNMVGCIIDV